MALVLCCVVRLVLSAPEDLPAPPSSASSHAPSVKATTSSEALKPRQTSVAGAQYAGTNQCFQCHRPQTNTWSATKHTHAFTDLPKKYQADAGCLKCHVTGFGGPGGFAAGTDKDLLMVGCESCHGPGDKHIDAAKRFVLADPGEEAKIEKEMKETIHRKPSDAVCIACHVAQAHGKHPAYEGQPTKAATGHPAVPCTPALTIAYSSRTDGPISSQASHYTVKTCGGCHYDQYLHWQTETHADLFAMVPAKYQSDPSCVLCHQSAGFAVTTIAAKNDPHHAGIGLACESCHGPALEHVRFNKQFISSPPLGPKLEQEARNSIGKGKSATACVDCHVSHSHKEHPKFEAQ
jgi:hypothetical protein